MKKIALIVLFICLLATPHLWGEGQKRDNKESDEVGVFLTELGEIEKTYLMLEQMADKMAHKEMAIQSPKEKAGEKIDYLGVTTATSLLGRSREYSYVSRWIFDLTRLTWNSYIDNGYSDEKVSEGSLSAVQYIINTSIEQQKLLEELIPNFRIGQSDLPAEYQDIEKASMVWVKTSERFVDVLKKIELFFSNLSKERS